MITIQLLGGLGNQMFQRAFGIGLQKRGYKVQYDRSRLIESTHREYSLGIFGNLRFGTPEHPNVLEGQAEVVQPPDTCTMIGYWQSEKYFAPLAREDVKLAFMFPNPPVMEIHSPTIALHVRRQDYVGLQHFHGLPTLDYYREAVKQIRARDWVDRVMVFSDDIDWCTQNLPRDFHFVRGTTKYEDMQLMSECDHIVTANSSFSWWAAWLGERPGRIVVTPKRWFSNDAMEATTEDLIPKRWLRV